MLFVMKSQNLSFLLAWAVSLAVFWSTASAWARLSLDDYRYSHLILIPLMSAGLVYWRRQRIFGARRWSPRWGALLVTAGAAINVLARILSPAGEAALALAVVGLVVVWIGLCVCCYGPRTAKAALFPLLFLLMAVPVPRVFVDGVIVLLQRGSAEITQVLFRVIGMAAFREGFTFSLPGINIEIAKECSSIRSGTALFITALLCGYVFIRSPWRRALLSALTIPIAMFTNAVRIVILSWLTVNVDRGYLYGSLHHSGGALFSLISVAALLALLMVLSEDRRRTPRSPVL